jgi:hypothetical protein
VKIPKGNDKIPSKYLLKNPMSELLSEGQEYPLTFSTDELIIEVTNSFLRNKKIDYFQK